MKYFVAILLLIFLGTGIGYAIEPKWPLRNHLHKLLPRMVAPKCSFTRAAYPKLKHDKYALHREAAKKLSDDHYLLNNQVQQELQKQQLSQKISNSAGKKVQQMFYGTPYLHPNAIAVIDEIEAEFVAKLQEKGLPSHHFVISSASRTDEKQRSLTKVNANATMGKSAHSYGAAIDIPYVTGPQCYAAGDILADILLKYRRANRVYLTPESNTIHVTVRPL